jgi:pilus assembly protein TadC
MVRFIFLEEFGKAFVPRRAIPYVRRYLLKAGIERTPYKFFGGLFYVCLATTLILYFIYINPLLVRLISSVQLFAGYANASLLILSFLSVFLLLLLFSALVILLVYFYLDIRIYQRTREMEDLLPDYLQVVASNLKGGLTFENALWGAIKPQFKILANEMAEVAKKVMTGYPVKRALLELAQKYDSPMLRRSVDLIISEIESGGNIAELLERIVEHLKDTKELKEEMSASAVAYIIFISVIIVVVSPLLFALSYNLLIVILGFIENLAATTARAGVLPFAVSSGSVNPDDFKTFSFLTIIVISFFASLIVSIVEKGNVKAGLKYIPLYVIGSLLFYWVFLKILTAVFATLL